MPKGNAFIGQWLDHVFLNTDIPNVGDATGLRQSITVGSLFLALHTADPGVAGTQATNEATYTGYARVALARTGVNFSRSGQIVSLVLNVDFGVRTDAGATQSLTHCSIGVSSAGATVYLYSGALSVTLTIDQNDFPRVLAGQVITES